MDRFLTLAIREAHKSLEHGGIPIGSVLVKNGRVIGKGHNQRVQKNNPVLHAEIDCLQNAGRIRNYKDCTLYSTLMPCFLCAGAIAQFGIRKLVVGENKNFKGAEKFLKQKGVRVTIADSDECIRLMKTFIAKNKKLWNEDIGKN